MFPFVTKHVWAPLFLTHFSEVLLPPESFNCSLVSVWGQQCLLKDNNNRPSFFHGHGVGKRAWTPESSSLKKRGTSKVSWSESFYGNSGSALPARVGGQFMAVGTAARKRLRLSLSHAWSLGLTEALFFLFGQTWKHEKTKQMEKKKSVTESAKKNSLQVADWQAALSQALYLQGQTRWQLPGCSPL